MIPYLMLSTLHDVELENIKPDVVFTSSEKSTQYLVKLVMKIQKKTGDVGRNDFIT